jgi:hypothetical protein
MGAATVRDIQNTARVFPVAHTVIGGLGCLSGMRILFAIVLLMQLPADARKALLEARESVWRAFFSNDRATLERLLPEETRVIDPGSPGLGGRQSVLDSAERFAKSGAKLVRLEFPTTEIQSYGNVAIIYSTYLYELEDHGKRAPFTGRITEIFVDRKGEWVNPGWHMEAR